MKGKLIKTKDKFILVSDEEIKESCYVYKHANNPLNNGIFIIPSDTDFKSFNAEKTDTSKIIACIPELPQIDLSLSLKNCQAIEHGYDLDELAKSEAIKISETEVRDEKLERIYKRAFSKALEILGDKKFSEEDLDKAFDLGKYVEREDCKEKYQDYKQSLQQTEWDVIVEMECVKGCQNLILNGENSVCCGDKKPKISEDGCLILKRI